MVHFAKWKIVLILAISALGLLYAAPNLLDRREMAIWAEDMPGWLPVHQVNLGLDLQGGSHLLIRVEFEEVIEKRLEALEQGLRPALRSAGIGYTGGLGVERGAVVTQLRDIGDANRVRDIVEDIDEQVDVTIDPASGRVAISFPETVVAEIGTDVVGRAIEVIRRRVDEFGTTEPIIQRQGDDRILLQVPGASDPQRLKEVIGPTAKMDFFLLDETAPPGGPAPPGSILLPSIEKQPSGAPSAQYVVRRQVQVSGENLIDAQATVSENRPVVSFRFDSAGARRFANTTRDNVGKRLAIVLDGEVISAPVIQGPIPGGNGIITGNFTVQTANDLALLLRAGALPADLSYIEERSVGPGLGADSIAAGQVASVIGLALVVVFMIVGYGLLGLMAVLALFVNLALLLAVLSVMQATLTLPGIAGIVLTVGMAVDANVLIFERIREEIANRRSPISAIDAGYGRALTTIIDSNLTTLIAAILLFALGSGPVKGFAVTLSIGILSSMFTAVMLTRLMVVTWLRRTRPTAIPI
ncbi:MAG: protein translocase subunit SecD [Inquilinus sp.]|nr:protein translocase subunit SecD [Inquilinus sp.]